MKTRTYLLIIILLIASSVLFASKKIPVEDTYGTWVNSDYNETGQYAKIILNPDRTLERFFKVTDTEPYCKYKYTITDSWHDHKGNLWIKFSFITNSGRTFYVLSQYNKSGTIMEWVDSEIDYPTEMSPIAGFYGIYNRQ